MVTGKTVQTAAHIGQGKNTREAQLSFSGPGVCLLAVLGSFGKTYPLPSAILERLLNIFVEEIEACK